MARLFFLENLAVGAVALVLGVVLGNLMFQILRAIMLALFGVEYRLSFAFSLEAVGMTLLYVLLVYLLALGRSRRRIRRMQIHDFMELDRQNENVVIRTSRRRRRVFVLSLLLGAVGTVLLLAGGCCLAWWGRGVSSPFLWLLSQLCLRGPRLFEKHPGRKYRGQTLVIFRTLTAKLATMGVVMATISLLFTATLLSEGSGMVFSALFQNRMEKVSAFDLYIGTKDQAHLAAYQAYLNRAVPVTSARQYSIYQGENAQVTTYCLEKADYHQYYDEDTFAGAVGLQRSAGHEGLAGGDPGAGDVSVPLPGLPGPGIDGLSSAHLRGRTAPDPGGGPDRGIEPGPVGCQRPRLCDRGPGPAGGGAAGEPQCSGCHDGTAGDGGAVCRVMYHP